MVNQNFQVTLITAAQIPLAAATLAQAFSADPLNIYACPDPAERTRVLSWLFAAMIRANTRSHSVYVTAESLKGVAIWLPPSTGEPTVEHHNPSELDQMSVHFGPAAYKRFASIFSYFEPLHKQMIQDPHWYLALLGVIPHHQGQGIGSTLIAPVLRLADKESIPCYLETFVSRNVSFYQRHDFQVVATAVEPQSGISCWIMKREPGPSIESDSPLILPD